MKLVALKALVAAVETGSLRSAARQLGLSQPALTKTVRELELELGASLLMRSSKGVQPTAQGKLLFEQALKTLRELETAVGQVHQLGGRMAGELTVGAVPLAVMLLIPETLWCPSRRVCARSHDETLRPAVAPMSPVAGSSGAGRAARVVRRCRPVTISAAIRTMPTNRAPDH